MTRINRLTRVDWSGIVKVTPRPGIIYTTKRPVRMTKKSSIDADTFAHILVGVISLYLIIRIVPALLVSWGWA